VLFLSLGANSVWDANEAFYVETPRQMVLTGDYLTPVFNGAERLNKPVLSYWIVAGLYRVLGVSVAVERVGIALGVLAIAVAVLLIGRALHSTAVGLLAALIVLTAPRVVMWGRRIFIDVYLTAFMSIALAAFVLAERHPNHRRTCLLVMYVALGLGALTKGPVALVLPAVALAVWFTVEGTWRNARRLMLVPGAAAVLAIVVPWYAALVARHGWAPVTSFFVGENFDRFTTAMQPDHRPIWFYVPVLLTDLFPWAPLVVVPLAAVRRRRPAADPDAPDALRRLLWIWIAVIVGAFSLSATKQDLYIFPAVAAAAPLIALTLADSAFGRDRRLVRLLLAAVALASAVAGGLVLTWFAGDGYYGLAGARTIGAVLIGGGLASAALAVAGRGYGAVVVLAGAFVTFNYIFVTRTLPAVERLKPVVPLADTFRARAAPGAVLGAYRLMLPSLVYYAGQPVQALDTLEQAREFYAGRAVAWAILDDHRFDELARAVPGLCIAARRPRLDPRLADVMAGRPPADVVLVTNQCQPATN
jgi:4-amino-4-deoxy-L-arabinose transferase-like glycosyltransferase